MTKVVDIFAGPGGLSEGFASVKDKSGEHSFDVVLSIEKEYYAFETLKLRTFFRQFSSGAPDTYYKCLRGELTKEELYALHPREAEASDSLCWHAELGSTSCPVDAVRERITKVIGKSEDWVLIGGPPCQAYSVAGRSRNNGNPDYDPNKDARQHLYVEYLQILADHWPAVFIMENVKGLLSATLENELVFQRIVSDLRDPVAALAREERNVLRRRKSGYRIYSLVERQIFEDGALAGAVIQAENYGVPQARHRVILLGVRNDLGELFPDVLKPQPQVPVSAVIGQLPALRSGLSRRMDSSDTWQDYLRSQATSRWANGGSRKAGGEKVSALIRQILTDIKAPPGDRGGEFVVGEATSHYAADWYCDDLIGGVCNHRTREHMEKDLHRYLYAACYAELYGRSPSLQYFPKDLLPDHINVTTALKEGGNFSDRFRVQVADRPSTTIVSHIHKDGHYYIHPDPYQCRSLTVREAARLQTFPDNYFFCGSRTSQYIQVGNAVPPLLAHQIGEIVLDVLSQAGGYH